MLMRQEYAIAADDEGRPAQGWAVADDAALAALVDAAAPLHAFLRPAWYRAAASDVTFHVYERNGEPVAAFPIAPHRMGPLTINEVAGAYWPFRSVPIREDAGDAILLAMLSGSDARAALGKAWRVGPIQGNDPSIERLLPLAAPAGWAVFKRTISHSYDIDVAALRAKKAWPSKSAIRQSRNYANRLGRIGEVSYRKVTGADWTAEDRDALARIEAESWLAEIGDGADTKFLDPERRSMWEDAARDPVLAPLMFANIMYLDEAPIAFTFGLEVGDTRYQIANNFSEKYKEYSPGRIILTFDFADAAERGVPVIDWGAGDGGYKARYGAKAGPEICDLLFVDDGILARMARPLLKRQGWELISDR